MFQTIDEIEIDEIDWTELHHHGGDLRVILCLLEVPFRGHHELHFQTSCHLHVKGHMFHFHPLLWSIHSNVSPRVVPDPRPGRRCQIILLWIIMFRARAEMSHAESSNHSIWSGNAWIHLTMPRRNKRRKSLTGYSGIWRAFCFFPFWITLPVQSRVWYSWLAWFSPIQCVPWVLLLNRIGMFPQTLYRTDKHFKGAGRVASTCRYLIQSRVSTIGFPLPAP